MLRERCSRVLKGFDRGSYTIDLKWLVRCGGLGGMHREMMERRSSVLGMMKGVEYRVNETLRGDAE